MTHASFDGFVSHFLDDVEAMVATKNADYAGGDPNPFAAFDEAAASLGLTREQVWAVFFLKHVRAILRWVASGELASEDVESRLVDLAAYPAILAASVREARK